MPSNDRPVGKSISGASSGPPADSRSVGEAPLPSSTPVSPLADAGCLGLLFVLALVFFHELVQHPAHILYSPYSDLIVMHAPKKRFLTTSFRETGELPQWCPYEFAGTPFLHDIQVAAFYPPHSVLYFVSPEHIGAALSWLVVAHVIIAGWSMFALARSYGLSRSAAVASGASFMFAGKAMLHVLMAGHYVAIGLAWTPLVLLGLRKAILGQGWYWSVFAGGAFALVILGTHPQWIFYAGLLTAIWGLGSALEGMGYFEGRRDAKLQPWRFAARTVGYGLTVILVSLLLSAVQLLPTLDFARVGSREEVGARIDRMSGESSKRTIAGLVGPYFKDPRIGLLDWEFRTEFPVLATAVLLLGFLVGTRRELFWALTLFGLVMFAIGGANLLQSLPGFRWFRMPSRMTLNATLPFALLLGGIVDRLQSRLAGGASLRRVPTVAVLAAGMAVAFGIGWYSDRFTMRGAIPFALADKSVYGSALFVMATSVALLLLIRPKTRTGAAKWGAALSAALIADAMLLSMRMVDTVDEAAILRPSKIAGELIDATVGSNDARESATRFGRGGPDPYVRFFDRGVPVSAVSPITTMIAFDYGLQMVGGYNPLDVRWYKIYWGLISDSLRSPDAEHVIGYQPIENRQLFDLLGVKYMLQPSDPKVRREYAQNHPPISADVGNYLLGIDWHTPKQEQPPVPASGWIARFQQDNPIAYVYTLGGMSAMGPYTAYENERAFPRAFVVPQGVATPPRPRFLVELRSANFRKQAWLEDYEPQAPSVATPGQPAGNKESDPSTASAEAIANTTADAAQPIDAALTDAVSDNSQLRPARIVEYQPNRVTIEVDDGPAGFLVLSDVWYDDWKCTVDDQPSPVHRANVAFRAVPIDAGPHRVVFAFDSRSYAVGRYISMTALGAWIVAGGIAFLSRRKSARSKAGDVCTPVLCDH